MPNPNLYDPYNMKDGYKPPEPSVDEEIRSQVERTLFRAINRETHKGAAGRVRSLVANDIMHLLTNRIEAEAKAFGGCRNCYGKGYASYSTVHIGRHYFKKVDDPVFCKCDRGTQLKAMFQSTNKQESK